METTDFGDRIRLPWDKPNPPRPIRSYSYARTRPGMGPRKASIAQSIEYRRTQLLTFLPLHVKNHIVAVASEFAGTFMFLLFAFGGTNVVNSAPQEGQPGNLAANPAKLQFISLCFGMSLAVNAWTFFRISGGLFNPAVTIGMMVVGGVDYVRGVLVIISQIAGGIAASAVVLGILPGDLNFSTTLSPETSVVQGLFIEMFLTTQLVFTIFMLAAEKHRATFIAPVGIGLSLFIAELMGVYYTGGSLNPARSFGPAVVMASFDSYHWIYWVGPILGALLASAFYVTIKAFEYETVSPEQDHSGDADAARHALNKVSTNEKTEVSMHEHAGQQQHAASGAGDQGYRRNDLSRAERGGVLNGGERDLEAGRS